MTWRPLAALSTLEARSSFLAEIRGYFTAMGYLEVEVPTLALAPASDPWLDSFEVHSPGTTAPTHYLLTSPEAYLKRLLARDQRAIFCLARAYRAEPQARLHNPEFTMLEWYQPGGDFQAMCAELQALSVALGFGQPRIETYRSLFESVYSVNPHQLTADAADALVRQHLDRAGEMGSLDFSLNLLFSAGCEPRCDNVLVTHFPASQAAMSRLVDHQGDPLCLRVEWYLDGVEIANGYDELVDCKEQARRALADLAQRAELNRPSVPMDQLLLDALDAGLPASYGVALGVDRLFCTRMGLTTLSDGLSFRDITG